ncbi:response regulator transcription factor [Clostridium butyricum]|uniref:response regulator transcription factor n=1 Tax=Clostridium butyricum TaxID=1492 RepID=UPI000A9E94F0|nr:response regulator [Clostridium butyricum]
MKTILIVEEKRTVALAIKYTLKKEGFEVKHATNLKSARNKFKNNEIDIILLDVILPDGEGYELCAEI